MKIMRVMVLVTLIVGGVLALHVAMAQPKGVKRADLQRHDLSVSGREVIQTRVELAPGVQFPKHWHPGEEMIYMLEGSLEYQIEDKPWVTLQAGDVLFIPARTAHAARNVSGKPGAELATYFVEKGKQLVVIVK